MKRFAVALAPLALLFAACDSESALLDRGVGAPLVNSLMYSGEFSIWAKNSSGTGVGNITFTVTPDSGGSAFNMVTGMPSGSGGGILGLVDENDSCDTDPDKNGRFICMAKHIVTTSGSSNCYIIERKYKPVPDVIDNIDIIIYYNTSLSRFVGPYEDDDYYIEISNMSILPGSVEVYGPSVLAKGQSGTWSHNAPSSMSLNCGGTATLTYLRWEAKNAGSGWSTVPSQYVSNGQLTLAATIYDFYVRAVFAASTGQTVYSDSFFVCRSYPGSNCILDEQ